MNANEPLVGTRSDRTRQRPWPKHWTRQLDRLRKHPATVIVRGKVFTGRVEKQGASVTVAGRRVLWAVQQGGRVEHPESDRLVQFARMCAAEFKDG